MDINLTVNVRHHIIKRAADSDKVGYLFPACQMVYGAGQTESGRIKLHAERLICSCAFNVHAESSSASFNLLEPVSGWQLDDLGHFGTTIAFRNPVDKLRQDFAALFNFTYTSLETGH